MMTPVVDWNLGVYRGDRRLALVQTRFDREWFVRRPAAETPSEPPRVDWQLALAESRLG